MLQDLARGLPTMAPKGAKYNRDVLQGVGRRSVAQALERLGYDVALTCD